jgi:hypothetical protein
MYWLRVSLAAQSLTASEVSPTTMYRALELYYLSNGIYDQIAQYALENAIWTEAMKPFRNPAHRAVEFYVSKLWPGNLPDALPVTTENKLIIDPISQIWKWSNWAVKKQLAARWLSLFGDNFIKIATKANPLTGRPARVYMQLIKPENVTDFEVDERDNLTWAKIDVLQATSTTANPSTYWLTEVWDKAAGMMRIFKHNRGPSAMISDLGNPIDQHTLDEFGIDFIPIVHAKFQDIGEKRGIGCFVHALDKIDEANRQATRLAQMIFRYNRPTMAVSGGTDAAGRPLPAPRLGNENSGTSDSDTVTVGDDMIMRLPGSSKIEHLVPPINFDASLSVLKDQMAELEQDLPELSYYNLKDLGANISGRAVRLLLSDAVDKALEARGNAENALARAHQMALTIGVQAGIFSNIGTFEAGDFDHTFADRPIIPITEDEQATMIKDMAAGGLPMVTALRRASWTASEIKDMQKDQAADDKRKTKTLGQALLDNARNFDQGGNPPDQGDPPPNPPNPAGQ